MKRFLEQKWEALDQYTLYPPSWRPMSSGVSWRSMRIVSTIAIARFRWLIWSNKMWRVLITLTNFLQEFKHTLTSGELVSLGIIHATQRRLQGFGPTASAALYAPWHSDHVRIRTYHWCHRSHCGLIAWWGTALDHWSVLYVQFDDVFTRPWCIPLQPVGSAPNWFTSTSTREMTWASQHFCLTGALCFVKSTSEYPPHWN